MKNGRKLKILGIALAALIVALVLMFLVADFIYYKGINKKLFVELGDDLPNATEFLKSDGEIYYITDVSEIDVRKTGEYQVKINYNGTEKKVYIVIEDTVAPMAEGLDVDISVYE